MIRSTCLLSQFWLIKTLFQPYLQYIVNTHTTVKYKPVIYFQYYKEDEGIKSWNKQIKFIHPIFEVRQSQSSKHLCCLPYNFLMLQLWNLAINLEQSKWESSPTSTEITVHFFPAPAPTSLISEVIIVCTQMNQSRNKRNLCLLM